MTMTTHDLQRRAQALQLHGLLANWSQCADALWIHDLIAWEESERLKRSLNRRLEAAKIGKFKPMADFDWSWPEQCDQDSIRELMGLEFIKNAGNAILVGPSGVGKTMIASNIAHQAALNGYTVIFASAGKLLGELAALDSDSALRYRLRRYASVDLLVMDEVGYMSYNTRCADLMFELINRRHECKSTIVTTNRSFSQWNEVFDSAACITAMVDRLIHHGEVINFKGKSYREKEARERATTRAARRKPAQKGNVSTS